jgi:hypothetical protein
MARLDALARWQRRLVVLLGLAAFWIGFVLGWMVAG